MATNVTVFAVDGPVVIYFQDGSSEVIEEQTQQQFQLPEGGFCTVSDAPPQESGEEEGEHPPPGYALANAMIEFWNRMKDRWHAAQGEPEVNPL